MPHPNDLPTPKEEMMRAMRDYPVLDDTRREPIDPSKIEGPRLFSVTVVMTQGGTVNVENALILAETPEIAKGLGLTKLVGKGWLVQKIDAASVPRAFLLDALAKIVA